MKGLVRGDLGRSIHFRQPVPQLLLDHYPATLELALASMVVALLVAVPLGILADLTYAALDPRIRLEKGA